MKAETGRPLCSNCHEEPVKYKRPFRGTYGPLCGACYQRIRTLLICEDRYEYQYYKNYQDYMIACANCHETRQHHARGLCRLCYDKQRRKETRPKYSKQHKSLKREMRENKNTRARRECLRCGKMFMSAGPWNRICPNCQSINENIAAVCGYMG